ncbi:VCBS repeat-containing protein, partial [Candidatus Pacearchaeota archaeon]|nr:VCBS repeat-containing protein [Candidatus Pacearchaeota archaeon]
MSNFSIVAQSEWREDSFEDFRDGSFLDAGSNSYVSANGRIQMINRWDFNNDGFLDILLPAGHGHTEKENLFIYLNNGVDIDGRSRIELTGGGSRDGQVADFNKDGYNDLVIANAADSHFSRVNSWIWYGSVEGFLLENRMTLPAYRGNSVVLGDFNNDDWIDLAIACQWQAGTVVEPEGPTMSFIYWNSPDGFTPNNRQPLIFDGQGATVFSASDLDDDGVQDLAALAGGNLVLLYSSQDGITNPGNREIVPLEGSALATGNINGDKFKDIVVISDKEIILLPGNKNGYGLENSVRLKVSSPRDVTLSDVDQNGYDDIIVANHATSEGATWINSYIFLFYGDDLSNPEIIKLPTMGATGVDAADLNGDEFPEIVFSNQRVTNHLSISSYVYWNDEGHFYFGNHTQLPTRGPLGTTIGDVNNDNLPDVLFFNEEGGFRDGPTTTYVLWGDGTRNFSKERSTNFSTNHIFGQGHADLDDDNFVDLIFSHERFVHRISHEQSGLSLQWGNSDGYIRSSRLTMMTAYGGVRIADINKDGYLDIL